MGSRRFGREKEQPGEPLSDEAVKAIAAEGKRNARESSINHALILGLVELLPTVGEDQYGDPINDLVTFRNTQAYLLWTPPCSKVWWEKPCYVLGESSESDREVGLLLVPAYGPPRMRILGKVAVTAGSWSGWPELADRTLSRQIGEQELDTSGNFVLRPETAGNIHMSRRAKAGRATVQLSGLSHRDGGPRWVGPEGVPDSVMVEYDVQTHLAGLAETFGVTDGYSELLKQWQENRATPSGES